MRRRYILTKTKKSDSIIDNYLTIEALEDGLTAKLSNNCKYCVDGDGNWKSLAIGTVTESINAGQTISFRGNLISNSLNGIGTFTVNKNFNLKGNCMSMLFGNNAASIYSLGGNGYAFYRLFYNCTTLKSVSANFLPATTLAEYCYSHMFYNCTSLTTVPELPATTLTDYCYSRMFYNCKNLNYIKMLATDISATNCLYRWVDGVASTGTFVKSPDATWDVVGVSGVPSGWTVKFDGEEDKKTENYLRKGKTSASMQALTLDFPAETDLYVYYTTSMLGSGMLIWPKGHSGSTVGLGPGESVVSVDRIEPNEDDFYIYKIAY